MFLVRDPLGVKPLVYAVRDGKLAFGSEAKAVLASGLVTAELDEASLHLSMNVRYVPGKRTFFRGISRLSPGHVLEFSDGRVRTYPYTSIDWTPDDSLSRGDWLRVSVRIIRRPSAGNCSPTYRSESRCPAASTPVRSWP